jgi:GT2 family glycosyltransferase/glycosyltransferase involved in cell wall biosynthesis
LPGYNPQGNQVFGSKVPAPAPARIPGSIARGARRLAQHFACRVPRWFAPLHFGARLLWWGATLRLPYHVGCWLRLRLARRRARGTTPDPTPPVPNPASIRIVRAGSPDVTVIIPTRGQVHLTLRCLAAIAAHPPRVPIEVIVMDDASDDPAVAQLDRIEGVRLVRNHFNLGFLHSCNQAAALAGGEFLLFLNNDTEPCAGWLDAMVELIRSRADAGAVGARLIYPDGRLQEAGGIIWNDATGWNFGRGGDPDDPACTYVREVDYCSAAALLVRHALFARLNGFDPRYAPAYCEDSDLSFRLRSLGYKTLYQPRAVVVHIEGASHGTDLTRGVKARQARNRVTFMTRWAAVLSTAHVASGTQVLRARDRAVKRNIVLLVDHRVPEPDRDAGSTTMIAFIQALLDANAVVKFWSASAEPQPAYAAALRDMGVEVRHGDWIAFTRWIAAHGACIDRVLLSRPDIADRYLVPLRHHTTARVAFYGHDLHHQRLRGGAARRMRRLERTVWRRVDTVIYPSEQEKQQVLALAPWANVRVVQPYAFRDIVPLRALDRSRTVLLVAGFDHGPNQDAACWLAETIMPLLWRLAPTARLAIVGSHPGPRVCALAGPGVSVRANVTATELQHHYASSRVAVVPLRQGAGVKRKAVEALCAGLPLVTTPIGAQGLPGLDAVADIRATADEIAACIATLLWDDALWRARSRAGLAYARARFAPEGLRASLLDALDLPVEPAQHRQPLFQVRDEVLDVLQSDMQPDQWPLEPAGTGGAREETGGGQRQALIPAPGRADPKQFQRLDERMGALD